MELKNINLVIDDIETKIENYISIKDASGISDILEVLDDSLAIFRGMGAISKFISKKRFAYFLKGLGNRQGDIDNSMKRLYSYIDSEEKAEFISKIIEKVLKSNSKKAAFVLGIISSKIISEEKDITYKEIICINSLGELYDYDIDNLLKTWRYLENKEARPNKSNWFSIGRWMKSWGEKNNEIIDQSLELTIEKGSSLQLILKDFDSTIDIDDDSPGDATIETSESYKFTEAGLLLEEYCAYLSEL